MSRSSVLRMVCGSRLPMKPRGVVTKLPRRYEKAGELCGPAGYDVIQQTGEGGVYGQGGWRSAL